jgi:hypothetical protein
MCTQPAKIHDPSPKHRIFGRDCILSVHILKTRGASPCFAPPDVFEISNTTRNEYVHHGNPYTPQMSALRQLDHVICLVSSQQAAQGRAYSAYEWGI